MSQIKALSQVPSPVPWTENQPRLRIPPKRESVKKLDTKSKNERLDHFFLDKNLTAQCGPCTFATTTIATFRP
jgi:hypothetical protein